MSTSLLLKIIIQTLSLIMFINTKWNELMVERENGKLLTLVLSIIKQLFSNITNRSTWGHYTMVKPGIWKVMQRYTKRKNIFNSGILSLGKRHKLHILETTTNLSIFLMTNLFFLYSNILAGKTIFSLFPPYKSP